jgi:hypothetical protein
MDRAITFSALRFFMLLIQTGAAESVLRAAILDQSHKFDVVRSFRKMRNRRSAR